MRRDEVSGALASLREIDHILKAEIDQVVEHKLQVVSQRISEQVLARVHSVAAALVLVPAADQIRRFISCNCKDIKNRHDSSEKQQQRFKTAALGTNSCSSQLTCAFCVRVRACMCAHA